MLDSFLGKIRRYIIPKKVFSFFQPAYHKTLSFMAALLYRFPSKKINVIAVIGTKGKSSTVEIINSILEEAGYRTALSNTIRFKVGDTSWNNLYKMSMPGRFFAQKLLRSAVKDKCDYMIMEITSQGALFYRHRFIELNTLVFTNISPEHIEAHGSYENYLSSKLSVAKNMVNSTKNNRTIIVNSDDKESNKFTNYQVENKISFNICDIEPYIIKDVGLEFTLNGKTIQSKLSGLFNLYNILASITVAQNEGISLEKISSAIEKLETIPGRVEKIKLDKQDFGVIVDYAHTPDSLEKLYQVFRSSENICVLGGTGGGRDTWKRGEMGRIAEKYCDQIILTNEDPYDEDPDKIVRDVAAGIKSKKPMIIMDRREAIKYAVTQAKTGDSVLITGKGTDPYIMGPNDTKIPWSDANIAREELLKVLNIEK